MGKEKAFDQAKFNCRKILKSISRNCSKERVKIFCFLFVSNKC